MPFTRIHVQTSGPVHVIEMTAQNFSLVFFSFTLYNLQNENGAGIKFMCDGVIV